MEVVEADWGQKVEVDLVIGLEGGGLTKVEGCIAALEWLVEGRCRSAVGEEGAIGLEGGCAFADDSALRSHVSICLTCCFALVCISLTCRFALVCVCVCGSRGFVTSLEGNPEDAVHVVLCFPLAWISCDEPLAIVSSRQQALGQRQWQQQAGWAF